MKKKDKDVLTTGEAAVICHLSRSTVIKCFDNGFVKGYRVGPRRDRRIFIKEFLEFLKENNIPYRYPIIG